MATNVKKTVKTIKKTSKKIKENNDLFKKMSAAEKRVVIAKEVLSLMKKQKLKPKHMQWVFAKNICSITNVEQQKQLSDVIKKIPSCNVCAIGGLFMGAVSKFNNLTCDQVKIGSETNGLLFKDISTFKELTMKATTYARINNEGEIGWNGIKPFLKKFFSLKQLALIEYTFESGRGNTDSFVLHSFGISDSLRYKCLDFSEPYDNRNLFSTALNSVTSKLMVAIMKNIIKNNGTFIP